MPNGGQTGDTCVGLTFPRTGFSGDGGVGRYANHFDAIHAQFEVYMSIAGLLPAFSVRYELLGTLRTHLHTHTHTHNASKVLLEWKHGSYNTTCTHEGGGCNPILCASCLRSCDRCSGNWGDAGTIFFSLSGCEDATRVIA